MDKHIKTQDDEIKTLKEKVDTLMGNDTQNPTYFNTGHSCPLKFTYHRILSQKIGELENLPI